MYRTFIFLYPLFVRLASLWNPKARGWVRGRKGLLEDLESRFRGENRPVAWFHCASLGEFEQGRPLIEGLRKTHPGVCILLTFFSPSGLEISKKYTGADVICYLPMDGPRNARAFLQAVKPAIAVFVKYEFWHFYLSALRRTGVPTLLASAVFRADQPFFRWYGGFWRKMLGCFTRIFVQDQVSLELLAGLGLTDRIQWSGDTRFDRVLELTGAALPALAGAASPHDLAGGATLPATAAPHAPAAARPLDPALAPAAAFSGDGPVIVAGSTWDEDEKELVHFARTHPHIRFILAPHEISKEHIRAIQHAFPESVPYSTYTPGTHARCLIIDNIGMLSRLYQLGTITFVGGGFGGDGVHNVLEAAVWGKPVVFGPIFDKYREATELIEAGGGFTVDNALALESCFRQLLDHPDTLAAAGQAARAYVEREAGATGRILSYIQEMDVWVRPKNVS
ncbi:3-deoxy-D-manno-octulosonic acid transferase [Dinghuibacter silviterrae]|uniref:3-deoxy-D-manno-octulosonic acid transferase n=1 Tax=Dinghuibacter silviterrae TaxID=1539049 RepID=A0A4R8DED8_9BACT|nr:glycosyltransferase N-terminal domain-containing protein [Dinghuibacter silviterrae]TDW95795.1 3-deoxy-D-manno-octulosonic-acid transferase [Dinghuibacter silviterrae]